MAIIPTYGVCIVENFIEKFLGNINTNIDIVLEKLKQNKMKAYKHTKTASSSDDAVLLTLYDIVISLLI